VTQQMRASGLDRSGTQPLWSQLAEELRARVLAGEFGERFPTDRELVQLYGVSRHTVREAVRRLDSDGLLDRHRGRGGTRVRTVEFEQPVGTLYSLFREVEARGVEQRSIVVHLDTRLNPVAAGMLGLSSGELLVYLERIRLAGGLPLALDRVWLPAALTSAMLEVDFNRTALYDELQRCCDLRPDAGTEQVRPVLPTREERRQLELSPNEAVFAIERLTTCRGRLIEWRQSFVRGDRYAFIFSWPGGSDELQLRPVPATGSR
jgi:GntR family transcriptional regulator